jgi:hypothetical protein
MSTPLKDLKDSLESKKKDELKKYFMMVYKIGNHIIKTSEKHGWEPKSGLAGDINPNPYYGKIIYNGGLILKCYFGQPDYLLTPFGQIQIYASVTGVNIAKDAIENQMADLTKTLGLKFLCEKPGDLCSEERYQYYAVTQDLEGHALPDAKLEELGVEHRCDGIKSFDVATCTLIWERIKSDVMEVLPKPSKTKLEHV